MYTSSVVKLETILNLAQHEMDREYLIAAVFGAAAGGGAFLVHKLLSGNAPARENTAPTRGAVPKVKGFPDTRKGFHLHSAQRHQMRRQRQPTVDGATAAEHVGKDVVPRGRGEKDQPKREGV